MKVTSKKQSIKVPQPKKTAAGLKMFGGQGAPRKPSTPRIYTKATLRQDPTEFGEFGFGQTGLTGRS